MTQLEVLKLDREILRIPAFQNQDILALLRIKNENTIWAAATERGDHAIFEQLFDAIQDPTMEGVSPDLLASLGLLTATADMDMLYYFPAMTAAIHADKFGGIFRYKYDSKAQEGTRSLIDDMFAGTVRYG